MSRMKCSCGYIISDSADDLPYKADLLPDQSFYNFMENVEEDLSGLFEAKNDIEKKEWIRKTLTDPSYPTDVKNSELISDVLTKHYRNSFRSIYQCEDCGRILIQKGNTNRFISFRPDNDDWKGILGTQTFE